MSSILFPFLGGLGLFLIGMKLLSDGLVAFAGSALRRALMRFTGTPFKAFVSGTLATALVQSSSATTVTIIGFVSAGLLTFTQAIGFIIGTSLGNTATGWLVAGLGLRISLGFYTLPLIGIGALLKLLAKGRTAELGLAVAGFGIIFVGLDTMQQGMQGFSQLYSLSGLPAGSLWAYTLTMLVGLVMTMIMQSSTAAIATTLAALHAGAINFDQAAALVVGAAIGTTVTGALVTIGATTAAKRTALANIVFNLISGIIAIVLLPALIALVDLLNTRFGLAPGALSLAAFHTIFITVGVVLFMPFTTTFARLLVRMVPDRGDTLVSHLDDSALAVPAVAVEASQRVLEKISARLFDAYSTALTQGFNGQLQKNIQEIRTALDHAYDFLTRMHVPAEESVLIEQRMNQLHVIDHQFRLCSRMEHLEKTPIDFTNGTYHWAISHNRSILDLAQPPGPDVRPDNWLDLIAEQAETLDKMAHQVRYQVLQDQSPGGEAASALRTTDAFRWLARSGHHVWRICHYLKQARHAPAVSPDTT